MIMIYANVYRKEKLGLPHKEAISIIFPNFTRHLFK